MKMIQKSLICRCLIKVIRASPIIDRQGTLAVLYKDIFPPYTRACKPKFRQPIRFCNHNEKFNMYLLSRLTCDHPCVWRITSYLGYNAASSAKKTNLSTSSILICSQYKQL